jgi:hypothetical protein
MIPFSRDPQGSAARHPTQRPSRRPGELLARGYFPS